jgi:hypothetical protein
MAIGRDEEAVLAEQGVAEREPLQNELGLIAREHCASSGRRFWAFWAPVNSRFDGFWPFAALFCDWATYQKTSILSRDTDNKNGANYTNFG